MLLLFWHPITSFWCDSLRKQFWGRPRKDFIYHGLIIKNVLESYHILFLTCYLYLPNHASGKNDVELNIKCTKDYLISRNTYFFIVAIKNIYQDISFFKYLQACFWFDPWVKLRCCCSFHHVVEPRMSHAKELASQQIVPDFRFYELD